MCTRIGMLVLVTTSLQLCGCGNVTGTWDGDPASLLYADDYTYDTLDEWYEPIAADYYSETVYVEDSDWIWVEDGFWYAGDGWYYDEWYDEWYYYDGYSGVWYYEDGSVVEDWSYTDDDENWYYDEATDTWCYYDEYYGEWDCSY